MPIAALRARDMTATSTRNNVAPDLPRSRRVNTPTNPAHTPDALDKSLVAGIAWTGIVKWGIQAVSWVATLATVRLLAPTDYGLFGMAMVYVGFGQIVTE